MQRRRFSVCLTVSPMFEWSEAQVVERFGSLFSRSNGLFHLLLHSIDSVRIDSKQTPMQIRLVSTTRISTRRRTLAEPEGSGGSLNTEGVWVRRGSVEPEHNSYLGTAKKQRCDTDRWNERIGTLVDWRHCPIERAWRPPASTDLFRSDQSIDGHIALSLPS